MVTSDITYDKYADKRWRIDWIAAGAVGAMVVASAVGAAVFAALC